jgi:hypothetical protein
MYEGKESVFVYGCDFDRAIVFIYEGEHDSVWLWMWPRQLLLLLNVIMIVVLISVGEPLFSLWIWPRWTVMLMNLTVRHLFFVFMNAAIAYEFDNTNYLYLRMQPACLIYMNV